jgi:serine/threonine protein kinase
VSVFVSYSHEDESWKDKVVRHLRVLELQGHVELWDDRRIVPGENWRDAIDGTLASARVALLLVSANSLTSEFILGEEVPALLRRRASEGLRLIPVIVRPCAWRDVAWLAPIQSLPRDGRPLSTLAEHEVDTELSSLAREIRRLLPEATRSESAAGSPPTVPPLVAPTAAAPHVERSEADPLARYEVMKVVQDGPYGRVLKCTLRDSGETCIVKETDAERVSERALAALAEIACPNVAGPRRIWTTDVKIYEELPYVGGIALQQAVAPGLGGLDGSMLQSFYEQIRGVLEALHRSGVVHRDIHPANIYLVVKRPSELAALRETDPESAWLFDAFGERDDAFLIAWVVVDLTFATLADDADQGAYRHGPYTPEEQEEAAATAASDMYAFGASIFFGLTGLDPPSPLDRRVNPRASLDGLRYAAPSQAFGKYLEGLLALDPADRPPAVEHVRSGSVAPGFCGVLRAGDDRYALVDMFPSATRIVSRREALLTLREWSRESSAESSARLDRWIAWLSEAAPSAPAG